MSEFFNKIKAVCQRMSAKREIEVAEKQVAEALAKLEEKRAKLGIKIQVTSKQAESGKAEKEELFTLHHDVKLNDKYKVHDVSELTSFLRHNFYDSVLVSISETLIVDVAQGKRDHADDTMKLNVTETVKSFLRRVDKKNAKELNETESQFLINHLAVLYAIKHKAKDAYAKYDFSAKKKNMSLMSYSKYRRTCINDIYI